MKVPAYAATAAGAPLGPFTIERREPGPHDVLIDILFCGVCHSDIHQARDEWGGAIFPMVPGHEIVGRVTRVGAAGHEAQGRATSPASAAWSTRAATAHRAAAASSSSATKGAACTYNGTEMDRKTPTYGGYSTQIVVDEHFVLQDPGGARSGRRRAAAVRRHHHLLAAAPVGRASGRPRRRGRASAASATWR